MSEFTMDRLRENLEALRAILKKSNSQHSGTSQRNQQQKPNRAQIEWQKEADQENGREVFSK